MTRHTAGNGMNGVFAFGPFGSKDFFQLMNQVLSLSHRQAVSGHHDNPR